MTDPVSRSFSKYFMSPYYVVKHHSRCWEKTMLLWTLPSGWRR